MAKISTGGCACGAVRYEASGAPENVAYCHCSDCRKHTGAPTIVWVAFESQNVRYLKGKPRLFQSSPGVYWGFCEECGAPLIWEANLSVFGGEDVTITEFTISSLDAPENFVPDQHWYDGERIPWFDVSDNLPRFLKLRHGGVSPTHFGPETAEK